MNPALQIALLRAYFVARTSIQRAAEILRRAGMPFQEARAFLMSLPWVVA